MKKEGPVDPIGGSMLKTLKKNAGLIFVVLVSALTIVILICTDELKQIQALMKILRPSGMIAAVICLLLYFFFRMAAMMYYLRRNGCKVSWRTVIAACGAGQFYSAITPSASGGQPMQVLLLRKRGVPVSVGTVCVSVKFIGFQLAFMLMGSILWLVNHDMVSEQLYGLRWLVAIGYVMNGFQLVLVGSAVWRYDVVERICARLVRLGVRLHVVRRPDQKMEAIRNVLRENRNALVTLLRRPIDAFVIFFFCIMQVIFYMGIILCIYSSFGLNGARPDELLTIQTLLFTAAAFVPLPGAAGAQESGFFAFFRGIFPKDMLIAAMVFWRFITYYLLIVMGLLMMLIGGIRKKDAA